MDNVIDLAFNLLHPDITISLGGGSNVKKLAHKLSQHPELNIKVCSPSEYTRQICHDLNLNLIDITEVSTIEFGFDGCDAIDFDLNVLKSNGGIHTLEKEYAYKAEKYIIISPPERLKASLNPNVQLCLEVVSPSVNSVLSAAKQLGLKAELRSASAVASYARAPLGNYLIDCYCESWQDIKKNK
ncbi:ribose-5-phosphate isomerase A [Ligilactobacillus salivarius]|uniref:ribose-5-phosphate isomerase A n=1 Tax=Ligilactobacillus salivarius TaxID=1624 RepID=UPI001F510A31|nr:ribose-5-phosphate isomerase A [Ligilactobacillus salivarius]